MLEQAIPLDAITVDDLHQAILNTVRRRNVPQHGSIWANPGNIAKLRQLWDEGLSATQIASQMGMGLTRNAVLGKLHRLRVPLRERVTIVRINTKSERAPIQPRWPKGGPKLVKAPKPEPIPYDTTHVIPFMQTGLNQCRWIVDGENGSEMACGAPTNPKVSYCQYHMKRSTGVSHRPKSSPAFNARKLTGLSFRSLGATNGS